jgi:predicted transcriptional regulator
VISRYHDIMPKQTTVRLPEDLAREAEAVARAQGTSVNQLIIEALHNEIERVRQDAEFRSKVKSIVERDRKILDRLAE